MHSAFMLAELEIGYGLPRAVATVTANPAAAVSLDDRGHIAPGLKADLLRVSMHDAMPVLRETWRRRAMAGEVSPSATNCTTSLSCALRTS